MIDSNVIEWLDFGDTIQKIDSYSKPNLEHYFKFFRTLLRNRELPIIIDTILILISFIQLLSISSIFISSENDVIIEILEYLKNIFLLFDIINNDNIYNKFLISIVTIILLDIILMLIILFTMNKFKLSIFIYIVNLLNIFIFYYFIGPTIEICLLSIWCENGQHKFLKIKCFSNLSHIKYIIFSILTCLFYIFLTILYSIYYNEIGSITININRTLARVHCNYEFFYLFIKIIIFIMYFFIKTNNNNFYLQLTYESLFFIISLFMLLYIYKYVFFYNNIVNFVVFSGWSFISWFSLCIFLKILFKIENISNFIIIGWIIIFILTYKINKIKKFSLMSKSINLEFESIKSIEMYINNLLVILSQKNNNISKVVIYGNVKNFEEYISNNPEINFIYQKFLNDKYLNHKFNKNDELPILSFIYILYYLQLEKSQNKEEIILYICYFLINKLNNPTYAIFLISKIKATKHKIKYYKYLLTEDIKEHFNYKLTKNSNKESYKHVQFGSCILYYLYINLFKIKVYDALSNQIEYFDILKDSISNDKTTKNFLKTGESILKLRKEIIIIWNKLIELNTFNDELFKDFMIYLDSIVNDEILSREESKKYMLSKNKKSEERLNIYYSMFLFNKSSILLIDGYFSNGKILYNSPNFSSIFSYYEKELSNLSIDDLIPNVVQVFHKELINDAIKYSNINYIFKEPKNSLLKNKNGGLFNIKLFVKPVPNLRYGLIYFAYLQKIIDSNFIIVLDKDLKINGFTEMNETGTEFTIGMGYNLSQNLCGYHIGLIIPDILPLIEFKNGEFDITKKDLDLKGYLYSINNINEINSKVNNILQKIKDNKDIEIEDNLQNINEEYNELIQEINKEQVKPFNIFYKVKKYSFLNNKYSYYRIIINDDIITGNENLLKLGNNQIKKFKNKNIFESGISMFSRENNKQSKFNSNIKYESGISNESNDNMKFKSLINNKRIKIERKFDNIKDITNNNNINSMEENDNFYEEDDNQENIENKNNNVFTSSFNSQSNNNIDSRFNKLKLNIINKKEIFPIKIMIFLCFVFGISTILLTFYDGKSINNSFLKLSTFLDQNIFFNMTKMGVAVLYITSLNIKWQLHSCNIITIYNNNNISSLYEKMLTENVNHISFIKNFTNYLGEEYKEILSKRYNVELNIYGTTDKEKYRFNNDNFLSHFINNAINLLREYPSYLQKIEEKNFLEILETFSVGLNELDNLINQTYLYYISDIDGFKGEKKDIIINNNFNYFPIGFVSCGSILLCIFIIFTIYIQRINNIQIFFLNKLINFNSVNFENYVKNLDEIKKNLKNYNDEEEDKDDIENESESKKNINGKNKEKDEIKNSFDKLNNKKNEKKNNKKDKKNNIIQKKKKNKMQQMEGFFRKNNLFFGIKIIFILIISISYYIISILIEKRERKDFISFDAIGDFLIGVFKQSYDIFISFKREMEIYENNLTNCKIGEKDVYIMKLPSFNDMKTINIGSSILQLSSKSGFNSETLSNFIELLRGNACKYLSDEKDYEFCVSFCEGVLTEGLEQTFSKIGGIIGTVIEELHSINIRGKTFREIVESSYFNLYELFIELYFQKAFRYIDDIFLTLRNEKLNSVFSKIKIILLIYIIISVLLFFIMIYLVFSFKGITDSLLNFIGILPYKYLSEDEIFYQEILKISKEFY